MTRENIGLFTNPKHELYVAKCSPDAKHMRPGPDEVTLHVRATGICASDVHFWKHGRVGDTMVVRDEHILGHESSADVIEVGSNVNDLKPGDRVAIEPGVQCLTCVRCTTGCYNACPHVEFKSTPPFDGLLRRYVKHPARLCHKIGDMSYELGALLEPISVALAGLEQSGLRIGDPTLVSGAGPIGIVSAILSRAAGAAPLVITDLSEGRLELAKKAIPGIRTVLIAKDDGPKAVSAKIVDSMGIKPKICLECTGFEDPISAAIYSMDFRGVVEVIGVGTDFINIPFMHQSVNEITVRGLFRYANTWPRGIRLIQNGLIDPSLLVTHKVSLDDAVKGFETFTDKKSGALKVMIVDGE